MRCFWCDKESEKLSADHIVPRALGGTTEFTVLACLSCQSILSKAEHEVSRKSILAIPALVVSLPPRDPDRPTSGHFRPSYFLCSERAILKRLCGSLTPSCTLQ